MECVLIDSLKKPLEELLPLFQLDNQMSYVKGRARKSLDVSQRVLRSTLQLQPLR